MSNEEIEEIKEIKEIKVPEPSGWKSIVSKNDKWRFIGLAFIVGGQFAPRFDYELFGQKFATSELTLVGIGITFLFPILMRKYGGGGR